MTVAHNLVRPLVPAVALLRPFYGSAGWSSIDTDVISHEDGDHSGGFAALQQVLPSRQIITGPGVNYPEAVLQGQNVEICNAGAEWRWGEVLFEILSPSSEVDSSNGAGKGNNSSCVLRIRWRDIQRAASRRYRKCYRIPVAGLRSTGGSAAGFIGGAPSRQQDVLYGKICPATSAKACGIFRGISAPVWPSSLICHQALQRCRQQSLEYCRAGCYNL